MTNIQVRSESLIAAQDPKQVQLENSFQAAIEFVALDGKVNMNCTWLYVQDFLFLFKYACVRVWVSLDLLISSRPV